MRVTLRTTRTGRIDISVHGHEAPHFVTFHAECSLHAFELFDHRENSAVGAGSEEASDPAERASPVVVADGVGPSYFGVRAAAAAMVAAWDAAMVAGDTSALETPITRLRIAVGLADDADDDDAEDEAAAQAEADELLAAGGMRREGPGDVVPVAEPGGPVLRQPRHWLGVAQLLCPGFEMVRWDVTTPMGWYDRQITWQEWLTVVRERCSTVRPTGAPWDT